MSTPFPPEFLELQTALAGRFSIEREIGRGGMGVVYLARDVRLERPVAIKLLAHSLSSRPEMRRRFLREARIAAQCFHPNIVPIHAVEESGTLAYIVMSFVRGETLAQRLARTGPLDAQAVQRIARDVGWALAYAHERGVVHRDIKPENILLEEGTDRCLITDFGIALHDDPTRTPATGEVAGTASYMAPEQALGETVDGRADLYALGVTLFVAATGRHPFDGATAAAMIVQHAIRPAPSIARIATQLPRALADAIDRCLAKNVDDRFANASAFVLAAESSVDAPPLARSLVSVRSSARATRTLAGGAAVLAITTLFMGMGEDSGFSRQLLESIGYTLSMTVGAAALLRAVDAVWSTRKALQGGVTQDEAVRALAEDSGASETPGHATRARGLFLLSGGAGLALLQSTITDAAIGPELFERLVAMVSMVLPPLLIARGSADLLRGSRAAHWMQQHIATPIARGITRWFGGGGAVANPRVIPQSGATELVLDHAAHALFDALPAAMRSELSALPQSISALARDAESLRVADRALDDAQRAARAEGRDSGDSELASIVEQRERVQGRLAGTIAALEAIRLDLMRLAAGNVEASSLTMHLQAARDLEHRLDAEREVRALLDPSVDARS